MLLIFPINTFEKQAIFSVVVLYGVHLNAEI